MGLKVAKTIRFTLGLIIPWWITQIINSLVSGGAYNYQTKGAWYIKYTIGLILPWWAVGIAGDKIREEFR